MDIVGLVEFLVKNVVHEPEMVSVKQFDDDEEVITIEVLVSDNDMGAVIGHDGIIASSIRNIVQSSAYINGLKKIKINFDSF